MAAMAELTPEIVRVFVGGAVADQAASALIEWYANLTRGLASFPEMDLRTVEPPLRSMPGPGPSA
jgi:hypothetical protein